MISFMTKLVVADNTGAQVVQVFKILGGTRHHYAYIGDIVEVSVKKAIPNSTVHKHDVLKAVIVRTKKPIYRKSGNYIKFDENACVIIKEDKSPRGTRIFGPVTRELKEKGFQKITSLAEEVL